jgi:hypothetical protein
MTRDYYRPRHFVQDHFHATESMKYRRLLNYVIRPGQAYGVEAAVNMSRFVELQPCELVKEKYTDRRLRMKCDGTCAETRFHLSAKRTSPFKSPGEGGGNQFSLLMADETDESI